MCDLMNNHTSSGSHSLLSQNWSHLSQEGKTVSSLSLAFPCIKKKLFYWGGKSHTPHIPFLSINYIQSGVKIGEAGHLILICFLSIKSRCFQCQKVYLVWNTNLELLMLLDDRTHQDDNPTKKDNPYPIL